MKAIYLLLTASFAINASFAQKLPKADKQINTSRFYGKVIDGSTNKGLAATSVQIVRRKTDKLTQISKDIPVDGMLTLKNGDFNFENISWSPDLVLVITALGFKKHEESISANQKAGKKQGVDLDLGNIKLGIDPKLLQTVVITPDKPSMSLGIDRKVFNVDKNLTSAGGTAEDVMRSVPSLSVDIDGNVTLRNGSPQILVDGRPTTMTLEQIPADAIESVEIITNPSAKFDASGGGGGILNIVLKKNRKAGYNGSLKTGIDQRGKQSFGGDINVRQDKINVFASVTYRARKSISKGRSDRLTLLDNATTQLFENDDNIQQKANFFFRGGIDYLVDNRNTITASGYLSNGYANNHSTANLFIDTLLLNGKNSSFSQRLAIPHTKYKNNGATIGYKHLFTKAGKEWTADLNYAGTSNNRENIINTYSYDIINGPLSKQFGQQINGTGNNNNFTFQTDYTNPISQKAKIEMGARIQMKSAANLNIISYMNESGTYTKVPQLSSNYLNKQNVFAAYGSFTGKVNKLGYQLGLRIESSEYNGDVTSTGITSTDTLIHYGNNFPFSLFPSLFLTRQLSKNQDLQFSVTRRINRPDFWQLFPFTDYSDSLNLSKGNPNLRPEFTYLAELTYEKTFSGKNILLASAYYKYADQLITPYQEKEMSPVTGRENLVTTFINAHSSYTGGLELIFRQSLFTWWEMTSNLNLFTTRINLAEVVSIKQKNIYSWFAKLNNTFKLPENFSFEVSSEYSSKRVLPQGGGKPGGGKDGSGNISQPQSSSQGYIRPRLEVDAAIRYDFLTNKKASVTLHVSDVFRTDANNIYSESVYFQQNTYRLKDPQYFRIHFTWRFGKFDASLFKRKNNKAIEDPVDDIN
jgi:outer membrane receptor protein involved in Fe transport